MTWRTQPPEEGQKTVLRAAGIPIPDTKVEASRLIRGLAQYRNRRKFDIAPLDPQNQYPTPRTAREINQDN